jgi:hypothetical protein
MDATKLTATAIQNGKIAPAPTVTNGVGRRRIIANESAIVNNTGDHIPNPLNQSMMSTASWNKK